MALKLQQDCGSKAWIDRLDEFAGQLGRQQLLAMLSRGLS